jgi:cysteine desulfurase
MIYFDHNATTPLHPCAQKAMEEAYSLYYANPLSLHGLGAKCFSFLEKIREELAILAGAHHDDVIFTSGGTEADNLAIFGICQNRNGSLIVSAIEHPAVMACAELFVHKGRTVYKIPVDNNGIVSIDKIKEVLSPQTALVSIMCANNETGTLQPISEIGDLCAALGVPFHTDAVQAFGKTPLSMAQANISLLSLSSHKLYGPKGCGALIAKKSLRLAPQLLGGLQEQSRRGGTHNLPGIAGLVAAATMHSTIMNAEQSRLFDLTETLYQTLNKSLDGIVRNGHENLRLGSTLNVSFPGTTTELLLAALDQEDICVSGGAACHSGSLEPSAVIKALGRKTSEAISAIRFSLGLSSTLSEVHRVIEVLCSVVPRLREFNR